MPRVILGELQLSPFKPYPQLPFPKKLKAVATPRMPSTLPTTATAPARSRTPLVDSVGYSRGIDATPPRNLLNAFLKSASKRVEAGDEREGGTRSGTSSPSTSNKRVEEPSPFQIYDDTGEDSSFPIEEETSLDDEAELDEPKENMLPTPFFRRPPPPLSTQSLPNLSTASDSVQPLTPLSPLAATNPHYHSPPPESHASASVRRFEEGVSSFDRHQSSEGENSSNGLGRSSSSGNLMPAFSFSPKKRTSLGELEKESKKVRLSEGEL